MHEDLLEQMERRARASPEKMKLRKCLAEHPFGTIKRAWNPGYFLTKGLESANAEMSLTMLVYNIKRAIQILGVPKMVEALAEYGFFLFYPRSHQFPGHQPPDPSVCRKVPV